MANKKRTMARQRALQAFYQWEQTGQDIADIELQFLTEQEMDRVDVAYFRELFHEVPARLERIDGLLAPHLDRTIAQLDLVERSILRMAVYELSFHPEIPYRVIINEAVALAKVFGADQSHKFVNAVLDAAAGQIRSEEKTGRTTR